MALDKQRLPLVLTPEKQTNWHCKSQFMHGVRQQQAIKIYFNCTLRLCMESQIQFTHVKLHKLGSRAGLPGGRAKDRQRGADLRAYSLSAIACIRGIIKLCAHPRLSVNAWHGLRAQQGANKAGGAKTAFINALQKLGGSAKGCQRSSSAPQGAAERGVPEGAKEAGVHHWGATDAGVPQQCSSILCSQQTSGIVFVHTLCAQHYFEEECRSLQARIILNLRRISPRVDL
eukprot:1162066-Pelagomonas_calceolata.AAC.1